MVLPNEVTIAARTYFGSPQKPGGFPASLERVLVANLPRDFHQACQEIIGSWGADVAGTAQWQVRLLFQQPKQVWLAFRCGSRVPDNAKYYDERLAVFRLDTASLKFFSFGSDAENDSNLYHVEFAELLPLDGHEGIAFRVASSNDNPCCAGPEAIAEERLVVYADTPQGPREVLSVVTRREHASHDDVDGDIQTVYRAEARFERDARDRTTAVTLAFREEIIEFAPDAAQPTIKRRSERAGTLRYRWNPGAVRFDEVK